MRVGIAAQSWPVHPASCRAPDNPVGTPALLLMLSQWCLLCPLPTKVIRYHLFSLLLQGLTLVAAWLYWAKVSGHEDKRRCWLSSELLFSSLKI